MKGEIGKAVITLSNIIGKIVGETPIDWNMEPKKLEALMRHKMLAKDPDRLWELFKGGDMDGQK